MSISGPTLSKPIALGRLLDQGLGSRPEAPALVSATTWMSWRELDEASNRYAGSLLDLGLQKGDRVASLMPNRTATDRHDAPASTASTTRRRRSTESALAMQAGLLHQPAS